MCQNLVQHFWQRWHAEYLVNLRQLNKWYNPSRNLSVGDIVILRDQNVIPTKWSMGKIVQVHDGLVRVVTVKTQAAWYIKTTNHQILLPMEND